MKAFLVCLAMLISVALLAQQKDSLPPEIISREKAICMARCRGYYKTFGNWNAACSRDTIEDTWKIFSFKDKRPFLKDFRRFKGDVKRKERILVIDSTTGKIIKSERKTSFITYMN